MLRSCIFLFCLLLSRLIFAQAPIHPGYVILNNQDTVRGWFDYKQTRKNPTQVSLRKDSLSTEKKMFTIDEVSDLFVQGLDQFTRARVTMDMQAVIGENLVAGRDSFETKTVWLRVISQGPKLDLYEYIDHKAHYFVKAKNQELIELNYFANDENGFHREIKVFQQQLKIIAMGGLDSVSQEITLPRQLEDFLSRAGYNASDLSKAAGMINGESYAGRMTNQDNYTAPPDPRWGPYFFVFIGGGISQVKEGWNSIYFANLHFKSVSIPYVGGGFEIRGPRGLNDALFRLECSYSKASYSGVGKTLTDDDRIYHYEAVQKNWIISGSLLYDFLKRKNIRVFAGVGYQYYFSSYSRNDYYQEDLSYSDSTRVQTKANWGSIALRAGVVVCKRLELGAIAQLTGSFVSNPDYSMNPRNYIGYIAFHFNK